MNTYEYTKASISTSDYNEDYFRTAKVIFLSVNDVYDLKPNEHGLGGIAELYTLLKLEKEKIEKENPLNHVFFTVNGDFLSASQEAVANEGAFVIELLNYLKTDLVVFGNHEFDYGSDVLRLRMNESDFQWLGSNVRDVNSNTCFEGIPEVVIYNISVPSVFKSGNHNTQNIRIGIFGVCTDETPTMSYPGNDIEFANVYNASQACVDHLKSEGVDMIVALTHLSIAQDKLLAKKVPGIDLVLGGHDHEPFTLFHQGTMIHKSGQNAWWLGRIDFPLHQIKPEVFEINTSSKRIVPTWTMIANQNSTPDPQCAEMIDNFLKSFKMQESASDNEAFAITNVRLDTRSSVLRAEESNFGNMVADALRAELRTNFGLINGGFIRGDKVYESKTSITRGLIEREMPFPRPAVSVRILGGDLRTAIEQHLRKYPALSGSYPHVSGLKIVYNVQEARITTMQVSETNENIDYQKEYVVATSSFIANGGDGCTAWLKGKIELERTKISLVVIEYLRRQRLISHPISENRVRVIDN